MELPLHVFELQARLHARNVCLRCEMEAVMNAQNVQNRIAVGVDFTDTGNHALREAMRLSRQLPGSELHVIHVLRADKSLHDAKKLDELSRGLRSKVDELKGHVASVCAPPMGNDPFSQEIVFHVRIGEPAEAIHQTAVDIDADMIVVGTAGRSGVEKLILGSVAEELIRMAHVPVVVAHPKDFSNLRKSERPEPARPGEDLHTTGISHRLHLSFAPRTSHISGLV
jgi:nucleotide-binding universal stress UspA family protein